MAQAQQAAGKDLGPAGVVAKKLMGAKKLKFVDRVKTLPLGAKIGAAASAGALLVFGWPALVPVGLSAAGLTGWYAVKGRKHSVCMTPERIKVYEQAISKLKDAKKLRVLADEFEKAGCIKEAEHLRKRAALREESPAEQKARRQRYRKAMASSDMKLIEAEAVHFESIGADGAAKNLRTRLTALKAVKR